MSLFDKSVETVSVTHWNYVGPGSEYVWILDILIPIVCAAVVVYVAFYAPRVVHR